jgi:hypothetical protein
MQIRRARVGPASYVITAFAAQPSEFEGSQSENEGAGERLGALAGA